MCDGRLHDDIQVGPVYVLEKLEQKLIRYIVI